MRFQGPRALDVPAGTRSDTLAISPDMLPASVRSLGLLRYFSCVGGFRYLRPGQQHPHHLGRPRREPADLGGHREVVACRVMLGDRVVVDGEATVAGDSSGQIELIIHQLI